MAGAAALAGYVYILDKEVQTKFSGEKWQLPVWIYSRPLELHRNQKISLKQLENELVTLNYRKVYDPQNPGEYAVEGNNVVIIKRPFRFYDGDEKERALFLQFANDRIQTLKDAKTGATLAAARMDPIILDRITMGNEEDRIKITLQDVNEKLIPILTTIEDRDFYDHFGIKPTSIARAMIANIRAGRNVQGGSTLTQQLVKNFYLTSERSLSRKIKEALMSLIVEYRYSKNEILEAYLNEIYLGQNGSNGVYGFGLASYFYFGLPVRELDVGQISTLVAIIRGPSYYDPWRHKERTRERRDLILKKLLDEDIITP
ncbi:MAG: transglycosylase domain-containing protein, partial [Succinivibrionaceae bacterium]|nr:transglycosylase domain-containing protein [Succinivibrionaceae bacterium]